MTDSAAKLAADLAEKLRAVQDKAKLTGAGMAELVGHKQPWWVKLTTGRMRQPKIEDLKRLLAAVNIGDADVAEIVDIAVELNACYVRHRLVLKGQRRTGDPEGIDRRVEELTRLFRAGFEASPLNMTDVANVVGVEKSWVSRVLKGRFQRPNVAHCKAVAAVLGMSKSDAARVAVLVEELSRL